MNANGFAVPPLGGTFRRNFRPWIAERHIFELKPFDKLGFQEVAELCRVFHGSSVCFMVNEFGSGKFDRDIGR